MKILELFCGTKSFANVARARGHETFTVDFDVRHKPDMVFDIGVMTVDDLPEEWRHPDVVWASPPCQCFSVMVIGKNWIKNEDGTYTPKRPETVHAMDLVENMLTLIRDLDPRFYFIENPRAMLRKMPFMDGIPRSTVTYCQYGLEYQKATDIWNNCPEWVSKPICSPKSPCHVRAPRGSKMGVQGMGFKQFPNRNGQNPLHPGDIASHGGYSRRDSLHPLDMGSRQETRSPVLRAIVPPALCEEIIIACEGVLK
jgi:hypothetical protein